MSIGLIREGIGRNLATVPGLRVAAEIPDNPSPPIAVLSLANVVFDGSYQRGLTTYNFVVSVIVGRAAEREAQRRLDTYISNGASSVKLAIESDKSLDGAAYDVRVSEMTNVGTVLLGDANYLAADFAVQVYAN